MMDNGLKYILEMMSKIDGTYPGDEVQDEPVADVSDDSVEQQVDGDDAAVDSTEQDDSDSYPTDSQAVSNDEPSDVKPGNDWHYFQKKYKGGPVPQFDDKEIETERPKDANYDELNAEYVDSQEGLNRAISLAYSYYGKNGSHVVRDESGSIVGFENGVNLEGNAGVSSSVGDVVESLIKMFYLMRKTSDTDRMVNATRFEMIERYTPDFKWLRSFLYAYSGILLGDGRTRKYSIITRDLVFKLFGESTAPVMLNEDGKHGSDRRATVSFRFSPEWDYPSKSSINSIDFENVIEQLNEKFTDGESKRDIEDILSNFGEYNDVKYKQDDFENEYTPGREKLTYQDMDNTFSKYDRIVLAFNVLNSSKSDYYNERYAVRGNDDLTEMLKRLHISANIYHQLLENGITSISIEDIFSGKEDVNAGEVLSGVWEGLNGLKDDKANIVRQYISAFINAGPSASVDEINEKIANFQLKSINRSGEQGGVKLYDFLSELFNGDLSMSQFQYYIRKAIEKRLCGNGEWKLMDELGRNFTTANGKEEEDLTTFLKDSIGGQKSIDMTLRSGNSVVFIECQGDDHYVPRYQRGTTINNLGDDYDKHLSIINSYLIPYADNFNLKSISELRMAVAESVLKSQDSMVQSLKKPLNIDDTLSEIKLLLRQASDKQKYIALNGKAINVDGVNCNTSYVYVKPDRYRKVDGSVGMQWPNGDVIWKAASIPFITNFDMAKQGKGQAIQYIGQRNVAESVEDYHDDNISIEIYNNTLDWSQRPENWEKGPYGDNLANFIGSKKQGDESLQYLKETIQRVLTQQKNRLL